MELNRLNIAESIEEVRKKKPVVHYMTNYVIANEYANVIFTIGAFPIMSDTIDEVKEVE